jgi:hypothetical protein
MININPTIRSSYYGNNAFKQVAEKASTVRSTGKTITLTREDWFKILNENKRRFECILRANPNDAAARDGLRRCIDLLDKLKKSML